MRQNRFIILLTFASKSRNMSLYDILNKKGLYLTHEISANLPTDGSHVLYPLEPVSRAQAWIRHHEGGQGAQQRTDRF